MESLSNMFGKMPKRWASGATGMSKMSLHWEPHAKTAFPSQIVKHCENDSWQVHCQKKEAYKRNRNGKHSEAARSMKWAVVDMFAKARLAREKSAARWKNTKSIHLTSIFNISDQGPKKFPKWVLGISKWAFSGQAEGQEMPKNKYWELQIQHFWAGPRKCQIWALGSAWETSKWILEASKWVLPNHVGLDKAREISTNGFRCYKIKSFWAIHGSRNAQN